VSDLTRVFSNARWPSWVTLSVAGSEGKKTDDGTMMWPPETKRNPMAVAAPPEAEASTPAATERASDILTDCKTLFRDCTQNLRAVSGRPHLSHCWPAAPHPVSSSLSVEGFVVAGSFLSVSPSAAVGHLVWVSVD
jgi:hypothetical protein